MNQPQSAESPKVNLNFGQALNHLKIGAAIQRAGWNDKGMFLYLNKGSHDFHSKDGVNIYVIRSIDGVPVYFFEGGDKGTVTRLPNINMKSASGSIVTGWLASQTDMLAEDWQVVESQDLYGGVPNNGQSNHFTVSIGGKTFNFTAQCDTGFSTEEFLEALDCAADIGRPKASGPISEGMRAELDEAAEKVNPVA